jgi:hypothetical protein
VKTRLILAAFSVLKVPVIVKSIVQYINSVSFYVKRVFGYINSENSLTFLGNDYINLVNVLTFSAIILTFSRNVPANSENLPAKSVLNCAKLENDYIISVINRFQSAKTSYLRWLDCLIQPLIANIQVKVYLP